MIGIPNSVTNFVTSSVAKLAKIEDVVNTFPYGTDKLVRTMIAMTPGLNLALSASLFAEKQTEEHDRPNSVSVQSKAEKYHSVSKFAIGHSALVGAIHALGWITLNNLGWYFIGASLITSLVSEYFFTQLLKSDQPVDENPKTFDVGANTDAIDSDNECAGAGSDDTSSPPVYVSEE